MSRYIFFFYFIGALTKGPVIIYRLRGDEDDLRMESFHFYDDRSYMGGGEGG